MFNRKPKSLRKMLALAVVRAVLFPTALGVSYLGVSATQEAPVISPERGAAVDPAQVLVEKHDCWTGEVPEDMEGQFPGHVVVTKNHRTEYAGEKLVGQALQQIFEGKDHNLTVHGFCR